MDDTPLHERMEAHDRAASEAKKAAQKRDKAASAIGRRLSASVADAVERAGANVEVAGRSADGHRYRFTARLDRAALVAALTESLPDGFVVSHVNNDGTLSIEWTGDDRTPSKRQHGAILKAIIAEELVLDDDGLVESVPTRERVLRRATELGLDETDAAERLRRLASLDVVDLADDRVYPDDNFSRY
ncbi:hypothetical protein EXE46_10140 [Halorubrum sp. GN11_10-6_MGM]|uniref:hypothetical protein n=1 Tax=Halorubrum sp. GN11_10-6_MGM TaxID=2518112 RepID=UPI0010F68C46|nr:hypothetical protein [Halorubrum sp. GN11_10-6_MGM]TKX74197.1 hypothetical protein EXE46_10140 [Halorubrum sp. GN11_10-6_MGM]